jgi:hypothetical protein
MPFDLIWTKTFLDFSDDVYVQAAHQQPIEIYELRETNDNNHQLYFKSHNQNDRYEEGALWKLLQPKKRNRSAVDNVMKDLLDKLRLIKKSKLQNYKNDPNIIVVNANSLGDNSETDNDSFYDVTRSNVPAPANVIYHV